jgi:lipid II:glycine glycyltransferase (peptidoglycan interpeptide bridge formation enzyme)
LRGGFDRVWKEKFKGSTRTGVRKAEHAGVVIESDHSARLVPVFYELYLRWIERRAQESNLPVTLQLYRARRREPLRKFGVISELLGDSCQVWVAWHEGQPVAAAIGLIHRSHAIYFRGFSDKALAGPSCANDMLQRAMIQDACRRGCTDYNMGGSGGVPGLIAFKARFGAVPKSFPVYTLDSSAMRSAQRLTDGLQKGLRGVLRSVVRMRQMTRQP